MSACASSAIESLEDLDASTQPSSSDLDGGITVISLDAGLGKPSADGSSADGRAALSDGGPVGRCVGSACIVSSCPDDESKKSPGICGCGHPDAPDQDGDKTPDCIDFCPGAPDKLADGTCGCAAALGDSDGDGTSNCNELCPFDPKSQVPGACGCGVAGTDGDADGTPDCLDLCPADPNKTVPGACGCAVSEQDTDLDGVPDCVDTCSGASDKTYVSDNTCGVGYCKTRNVPSTCVAGKETACKPGAARSGTDATCDGIDDDCDGQVDEDFVMAASNCGVGACAKTGALRCEAGKTINSCVAGAKLANNDVSCNGVDDDCDGDTDEDYPTMSSSCAAGACAAMGTVECTGGKVVDSCSANAPISSTDATCNNIDDDCDGKADEDYKSSGSKCGVGACAASGTISCNKGSTVDSCRPLAKPSDTDQSCNNIDDDCDGKVDDGFVGTPTECGQGVCRASGMLSCAGGATKDSCVPGAPHSSTDDAFSPGNGVDDDCDGQVDEDVPPCNTAPRTFEPGFYDNIQVPGNCRSVSVSLWGGGGAGGQEAGFIKARGGLGGPGGYATASVLINGPIRLAVGNGAANRCNDPGTNAADGSFNGGSGGGGAGAAGGDGSTPGGGNGGAPNNGDRGGDGHFGGGGGGAGNNTFGGSSGDGGGGGAASVFTVNEVRAALAGGGGGGGGAQGTLFGIGARGGDGGSGCRGDGRVETSGGGGGGGGGLCIGASTQTGSGTTPAAPGNNLPGGHAQGGGSSCGAGGPGYAIVTFAP